MFELVESRVRRVVSDHLGVRPEELASDVLLVDTLAADSLDLVELGLALETEFDIAIPDPVLDGVRSYGDLVDAVYTLVRKRPQVAANARAAAPPAQVWARVVRAQAGTSDLQRTGWLTPYTAEEIVEDALRAGRGARLELSVSTTVNDAGLSQLQARFAWLADRGVQVDIRRDHHLGPLGLRSRPDAAA
jgi:acyl carrier protein